MKNFLILLAIVATSQLFLHQPKANWQKQLAPEAPFQTSDNLPLPWTYKDFTITPRAKYHLKAVVLSTHHYWAGEIEDTLSAYDLALGWGPMSDAMIINQLNISQDSRWYNYHWNNNPPLDPSEIISHSSNNHIIAADQNVLETIKRTKRYDVIELEGYLVDIQSKKKDWNWHTSLSRTDTTGGSCELFWVTSAL